ncbi:OsmC/Ohr family [Coniella lustricola]|uniref:OsmC/Ohr family n=1 Tax=Coniella lustricola TaxID=2025994 RepID=A0A2T3AMF6_9PEZI|nr:OsmC/Ohr family [Coniella lustricola]
MASSLRTVSLLRQGPRLVRATQFTSRIPNMTTARHLNTATAPVLYSVHARAVGARTGHVEGDDLNVDLTMAKALGGKGEKGKTNPEELFAAGYAACFQSSMNASAASMGIKMPGKKEDSIVAATVYLVGDMKELDMGLRVDMKVRVNGLDRAELEKIVAKAEEVCPYSRATRGNVDTKIEIVDDI